MGGKMTNRVYEFDLWRPGYGGAAVYVYIAGTSTLATLYADIDKTETLSNPQILSSSFAQDGTRYGKFAQPIYIDQPYYLSINSSEVTGIIVPQLSSLSGEDASNSIIIPEGGSYKTTIQKLSSFQIHVGMYGEFIDGADGVAATNTTTLNLAIAAATNGGEILIPSGEYNINSVEIPSGVIIRGVGRDATVLKSEIGSESFTIVGDRAGFRNITLDGVSLQTGSICIYSISNDGIIMDSVMIKRFETGLYFKGGNGCIFNDLSIENTENGAKLHGDTSDSGSAFQDFTWIGGIISVATTVGFSLSYVDAKCQNILMSGIGFEDCTGTALDLNGCQSFKLDGFWFTGNTVNINVLDDTDPLSPSTQDDNDIHNILFSNGRFNSGEIEVTGVLYDVVIESCKIESVDFTMTTPLYNNLILKNCFEDENVTVAGETTKLLRVKTTKNGTSIGVTTVNIAQKAWSMELEAGQVVLASARVVAVGQNVAQRGIYHVECGAYRAGSSLAYDSQTSNFTTGAIITGATSGATARIQADSDGGTTGTLTLTNIKGAFIDNEIITDDNGTPGSATVNGTLTPSNVSLDTVGNVLIRTAYETNANWNVAFVANGTELELRVTGDTSQTVEWTVCVDVIES